MSTNPRISKSGSSFDTRSSMDWTNNLKNAFLFFLQWRFPTFFETQGMVPKSFGIRHGFLHHIEHWTLNNRGVRTISAVELSWLLTSDDFWLLYYCFGRHVTLAPHNCDKSTRRKLTVFSILLKFLSQGTQTKTIISVETK